MNNYKMKGREFFGWKTLNFFLLAVIITYIILYLFLQFGSYSLFFAGAIVGGLWGVGFYYMFHYLSLATYGKDYMLNLDMTKKLKTRKM